MRAPRRLQKNTPTPQKQRFIETARALGCDEDEAAFKAKLAMIAQQKPKGEVPPMPDPDKADD